MKGIIILGLISLFGFFELSAQKIVFSPQWTAQSQFAGYYAAKKLGFYRDAGLIVDITYPSISENPYTKLQNGSSDIVTMNLMQALAYRNEGHRLVNVMQSSHMSSLLFVTHFPVAGLNSFKNKKIGIWNYLNQELINIIQEKYKHYVNLIRFNSGVNLFLSKAIDATIASSYDEIIQLQECGFAVTANNSVNLASLGFDIPEEGVYVTEEYYNSHPELVRKFVEASIKGWLWVRSNSTEAVKITLEEAAKNKVPTNKYHQRLMLAEILRLQNYQPTNRQAFMLTEREFNMTKKLIFAPQSRGNKIKYSDFVKQ